MLPSTAVTQSLSILLIFPALIQCSVFLDQSSAGQILRSLSRRRRANSNFMEEVLPGNLERECYEETCSQEEASEIFQTQEKTLEFWFRYINLNPCRTNPCLNGGICTLDRGDFMCLCPPKYHGKTCDTVVLECRYRNGGCIQYCRDLPGEAGVQCGCADGFKLESDGKRCSKIVDFPCGHQQMVALYHSRTLLDPSDFINDTMETDANATGSWFPELNATEEPTVTNISSGWMEQNQTELNVETGEGHGEVNVRIVGGLLESRGGSPWVVLIHRSDGFGFCGGTLVSDRWVVTAAHCFELTADHVTIGDYDKHRPDKDEQSIKVQKVIVHPHFHAYTYDSDIALVYLAQPIIRGPTAIPACLPDPHLAKYLLKEDNRGMVTGWGATKYLGRSSRFLRKVTLPIVSQKDCSASTEQVLLQGPFPLCRVACLALPGLC
ncbi:coagulation factor IX isoform 2-T3 [Pholidichthys leucotaenia]